MKDRNYRSTFFCVNETRLENSASYNIFKTPGYDIVRQDRHRNVAIYIRNTISYKNHIEFIPDNLESICLEIRKPKSKPILGVSDMVSPTNC